MLSLLNPLIVNCNPDRFFVVLKDSCFDPYFLGLNVVMGFDVYLANHSLIFLEVGLVQGYPGLSL